MDTYLRERLEEYLAGDLAGAELSRFEARLEQDPDAVEAVARFAETSTLFDAIRAEPSEVPVPMPGFYARVNQLIEEEQSIPFWAVFMQPFMLKRLALGSLMWLLALGSLALLNDQSTARSTQLADMILSEQPPAERFYVRMGTDLAQNRESMLAVMMTPRK